MLKAGIGPLIMAETFVASRPVSVGVLEERRGDLRILPALEASTSERIYSYAAKRGATACDYHCPARLSETILEDLRRQAGVAHQALNCWTYSRHDFVIDNAGRTWWLEVNTLPSLSRNGNLARMAEADGLTYEQLILHILRGAQVDRRTQA